MFFIGEGKNKKSRKDMRRAAAKFNVISAGKRRGEEGRGRGNEHVKEHNEGPKDRKTRRRGEERKCLREGGKSPNRQ